MESSRTVAIPAGFQQPQARPSTGLIPLWWVLAPGVLGAAVLGAFVLYATLHPYSAPTPTAGATASIASGLAWGGTVLYDKPQVKSWLRAHGASYPTWKRRHPAASAIVAPKKRHQPHGLVKRKHGAKAHH